MTALFFTIIRSDSKGTNTLLCHPNFFWSCLLFLDGIDGPAWCQSSCNDKHFIFGLLRTNQYGNPSPRNTFPLIGVTQKNLNIDMGFIFLSTQSNAFLFQSFSLPGRRFQTQKMVSTPRLPNERFN